MNTSAGRVGIFGLQNRELLQNLFRFVQNVRKIRQRGKFAMGPLCLKARDGIVMGIERVFTA